MKQFRPINIILRGRRRWFRGLICLTLGVALSLGQPGLWPILGTANATTVIASVDPDGARGESQGTAQFAAGNYAQAVVAWDQAIAHYRQIGDWRSLARTLSNVSLAHLRLGQGAAATNAIEQSLAVLQTHDAAQAEPALWAQALNTQGNLRFGLGQMAAAVTAWEAATRAYESAGSDRAQVQSQMNVALALKAAGFYQLAQDQLADVVTHLRPQPDSVLKASALQRWGDILRLVGDLEGAETALAESLEMAQTLNAPEELAAVLLSLGNTKRVQADETSAQGYYQQAIALDGITPDSRILAQLASLSLLVQQQHWSEAQILWPTLAATLPQQPLSHQSIYNRINLAVSLIRLKRGDRQGDQLDWQIIATLLSEAVKEVQGLGDRLGQSYALGYLGSIYEQTQQWSVAQGLTEQALNLAQSVNAGEAAYLWQWQLARLLQAQDHLEEATVAYGESVETLKSLRGDLVTIQADIQFSFRENVEPVYREFVSLLLQTKSGQEPTAAKLAQARDVIESLQIAELDDYFQEACLQGQPVSIDQLETKSAVLYPIILDDRLELILSLPQGQFRHYSQAIPQGELKALIQQFRQDLVVFSRRDFFAPAQRLYDVLIRPAISDLRASEVETLVFVLDGPLKNIPMAALHDGQQYLIEEFALALSPGLQLISPKPLGRAPLTVLAAGLTEGRQGFAPLSYVTDEIAQIRRILPEGASLVDESFTKLALRSQVEDTRFPIVHIATHGQFSSNLDNTFLLTWDDVIQVDELSRLLQDNTGNSQHVIELLVLSACQTAAGDQRAALGLAGFAIRAGARSTLASLWSVNDAATSELISTFYGELVKPRATRASALQTAQLSFLANPATSHPLYWAPFVMLGSWL